MLSAASSAAQIGALKSTEFAYAEAAAYFREATQLVPKSKDQVRAEYLSYEGLQWKEAGRYEEAREPLEQALSIYESVLGPAHPLVATSLNNLALLYDNQGSYEKAEALYERALEIDEQALGPAHPGVATDLGNLAALLHSQGRYAEAEPLYERALDIREKAFGPDHPDVANSLVSDRRYRATGGPG